MDWNWTHILSCRPFHNFTVSFLIFVILSSAQFTFVVQGRPMVKSFGNSKIGSWPPRCEKRCNSCGHCEAIQVPTNPQIKNGINNSSTTDQVSSIAYSRGDDYSNYKPMSWKCKCGDLIFNP